MHYFYILQCKDKTLYCGYTKDLVKKVFPYVLIGVAIGALIHGYAPERILVEYAGENNLLGE
jgi:uncharacterized membrane protein YraQ (UPF0718 family)